MGGSGVRPYFFFFLGNRVRFRVEVGPERMRGLGGCGGVGPAHRIERYGMAKTEELGRQIRAYARWRACNRELMKYMGSRGVSSTVGFWTALLDLVHATIRR